MKYETVSSKDKQPREPRQSTPKKPKINYEIFVIRNLDMLKQAIYESIRQYQTKNNPKSRASVKRYREIFWQFVQIENEIKKI